MYHVAWPMAAYKVTQCLNACFLGRVQLIHFTEVLASFFLSLSLYKQEAEEIIITLVSINDSLGTMPCS